MPRISQFFGIVIAMYYDDHAPPHFHAVYGEHEASFAIATLEVMEGAMPRRAAALIREWALQHQDELRADWLRARLGQPLAGIAPLD